MSDPPIGACWHCGRPLTQLDYGREARCPGCDKSTRVCRNCRFFAPGRPNQCQEPLLLDPVIDKQRANFCDFFEPTLKSSAAGAGPSAADLLQAAEALFRK